MHGITAVMNGEMLLLQKTAFKGWLGKKWSPHFAYSLTRETVACLVVLATPFHGANFNRKEY
uniref:Uncharacterized protein n=1 Tax=Pristionchus pacificus TaxID=54126 RepID=A0A2A6D1Z9_PRIPA|eukprot:PDM84418.1 hypothetical protein PRIPAC_33441 [Pristionchus pacificus]